MQNISRTELDQDEAVAIVVIYYSPTRESWGGSGAYSIYRTRPDREHWNTVTNAGPLQLQSSPWYWLRPFYHITAPLLYLCPISFLLSPASVHPEPSDQSASWTQVSESETDFWGVHPVTVFRLPSQLCKHAVLTQMQRCYKHERWLMVVIVGMEVCTGLGEVVSQIKIHSFVSRARVHRRKGDRNDKGKGT